MNLNDLLKKNGIAPERVLVFRHRPFEVALNRVFPWLASEKPEIFNAYQQTQGKKVEKAMGRASYIASFIGQEAGKALFVGLYSIGASKTLNYDEYWQVPAYIEMRKCGMKGFCGDRPSILWFDLSSTDFYSSWKGKLVVEWPGKERSWWRRADKNEFRIFSVLETSALEPAMPSWDEIVFNWEELAVLPSRWKSMLSGTRAIYYISDSSDSKGYVGSAYGDDNLLGRWKNYSTSGHGGNVLLRKRNQRDFRFSILPRLSPDMHADDVIRLECTWKKRLNTYAPFGLNQN